MSQVIPFNSGEFAVRAVDVEGELWFVGKDVADALGYVDATTALRSHCKGVQKLHPLQTPGGTQNVRVLSEPDVLRLIVNSSMPSAERFERWVFEDVLPSIRKTGRYEAPRTEVDQTLTAAKLFAPLVRVARLIGCDKNAAAISANQAVQKLTGANMLQLLGQSHMQAANQEALYFTPTELGKRAGTSARGMNLFLAEAGLQMKRGDVWEVTEAGKDFARIYDTGKKHGSGVPIQQIKWSATVLGVIGADAEAA